MKYDICVFGCCSLDQTYFERIDGTYSDVPDVVAPGGKGANQAVAAAKAGAKTTIITIIGKNEIGYKILDNLNNFQISTSSVQLIDELTNDSSKIYVKFKDKDNSIRREGNLADHFMVDMINQYKDVLLKSKIILCQLKTPKEVSAALINFCYENHKTLIMTPSHPEKISIKENGNLDLINKANIIMCNEEECKIVFNTDNINDCVAKYPYKLVVTLGGKGLIYHDGVRTIQMPAIETEVIDTTGAGDTLCGNFAAFLAAGIDFQHALRKAMYASAMKVTQKSAQLGMPYLDELDTFIMNMHNKQFPYREELNFALMIVKEAYESVRYNANFTIHVKSNDSLVTDVDLAIEKFLLKKIREKFPQDQFLTEEHFPDNTLRDRTWVIDPIDGTAHFIKKDGFWGIQLAFYDNNDTRFAVIYLPEKNELYYAGQNIGAYVNNERILPHASVLLSQAMVEFGGSLYKYIDVKRMVLGKLMKKNSSLVSGIIHVNSCAISYTNLVLGKTDALIVSTCQPWDIMPGEFLCRECGLTTTYLDSDSHVRLITNNKALKDIIMGEE